MNHEVIISFLKEFKKLPTYQLERRIDILLLPYLESGLRRILNTDDLLFVYPEFPLWPKEEKENILNKSSKRSIYADYMFWSKKLDNTIYFVELKTDARSVSLDQYEAYILNCKEGWPDIINEYLQKTVNAAENQGPWRKYCYGLQYLHIKAPELTGILGEIKLDYFLTKERGNGVTRYLKNLKLNHENSFNLKLLYLAPNAIKNRLKASKMETNRHFAGIVSLSEFSNHVDNQLAELLRFIEDENNDN